MSVRAKGPMWPALTALYCNQMNIFHSAAMLAGYRLVYMDYNLYGNINVVVNAIINRINPVGSMRISWWLLQHGRRDLGSVFGRSSNFLYFPNFPVFSKLCYNEKMPESNLFFNLQLPKNWLVTWWSSSRRTHWWLYWHVQSKSLLCSDCNLELVTCLVCVVF